ncbi:MAG TPA: radical SAM protein [bacterium]|nr:radical SAM protein [bacterium]
MTPREIELNKICLINPPTSTGVWGIYFPMGLVVLGSVLKERGYAVEIVDFDLEIRKDPSLCEFSRFREYALQRLEQSQTQLFGISSICSNFPASLLLAREIRRLWPSSRIIMGGPQPSAVPEATLRLCSWVDVIVIGEGEMTLAELVASDFREESLREIPGVAFRDRGQIIRSSPRNLIDDLDKTPFPDFSLVPLEDYLTFAPGFDLIEAGRGCPFLCSFCSTAIMWERKFRVKSPSRILEEMRRLNRRYGLKAFPLTHDNFTTSHSWVSRFCEYFKQNNHERFGWSVAARSDTLNPDRLRLLREAGCAGLFFGVDSGSPRVQKALRKHLNLDQFRDHLKIAVSLGLKCTTSFVIGFPEESPEDLEATINLGLWSKLAGANVTSFHALSPLSGTAIYEQNASGLVFDPRKMTDFALQPFVGSETTRLIASSPELFSSFHSVPTPLLEPLNVPVFAYFYGELVNNMTSELKKVFDDTAWSPLELFVRWINWMVDRYGPKNMNGPFILETFAEFLKLLPPSDHSVLVQEKNPRSEGSFGSAGL